MKQKNSLDKWLESEIDPAFKSRAKIILQEILDKFRHSPASILDLGCGRGFYTRALMNLGNNKLKITGIDKCDEYLKIARGCSQSKRLIFIKSKAEKTSLAKDKFDAVICSELLEHVSDDRRLLREIFRITKPGGMILISVPHQNYPWLWDPINWTAERLWHRHIPASVWWLAGIWAGHKRLYTENDLLNKIQRQGLTVDAIWRTTRWSMPMAHFWLYGVGKNIVERGILPEFNRFNDIKKDSALSRVVKSVFGLFDQLNSIWPPEANKPYTNIVIKCRKPAYGQR
jgi:2-polyprenyl-6-hydroxyphenyl methylase / 3-demethylubiquinone-9 3-methyltransferase